MLRKIVSLKDERMVAVGIHRVLCFQFEQVLNVIRYIYINVHSSPKKTPIKGSSCPSDSVACINKSFSLLLANTATIVSRSDIRISY